MDERKRMYELLEMGEQQDEFTFGVERNELDERVVQKMVALGLLENVSIMFGGRVVKLSGAGLQALEQARNAGSQEIHLHAPARPIHFQQTVHGTANTQVGDNNTQHIQMGAGQTEQILAQLQELRALAAKLPQDDHEEALSTINSAEAAVKKGAWERVQTYGPILLGLGTSTVEFAEKVKALFGM